jgi:hypothetical protein
MSTRTAPPIDAALPLRLHADRPELDGQIVGEEDWLWAYAHRPGIPPARVHVRVSPLGDGAVVEMRREGEGQWWPPHPATRFAWADEFL